MIGSQNRFHGYNSLRFVYRNGQTVRGPLFSITYAINSRRQNYRAAVVISRKVHKSALVRNRIRRRLYEIVRSLAKNIDQPFDIVITVFHATVKDEPQASLVHQMTKELTDAGILRPTRSK